jgi:hypothetical protein
MSMEADGHEQIKAGLALIVWSGLAARDPCNGLLTAPHDEEFEMLAKERHEQYGRVLSWAVFAIGCEYIVKGACLVRGLSQTQHKEVLRPPRWDEDLGQWSRAVLGRDPSVRVSATYSGTLAELPLKKLLANVSGEEQHRAAFELLRDSMRNRDAHQYVPNVRAAHFQAVPRLFIPALNAVIQSVGSSHC